mgnify:CR=1 FL=1
MGGRDLIHGPIAIGFLLLLLYIVFKPFISKIQLTVENHSPHNLKLQFSKNDKGELEINLGEKGQFKNILAKDYFNDKFKGIIKVDDKGGSGSGTHTQTNYLKMERKEAIESIRAELMQLGLKRGTDGYTKEFDKKFFKFKKQN